MAYEDLTPSNRFELALSGDMTAEEASNRIEQILAGADIEPSNRLEYFLKLRVSEGGGGGGGGDEPSGPFKFEYIGDYIFSEDGTTDAAQCTHGPQDTGLTVSPSGLYALLFLPSQMNYVNRAAIGPIFRLENQSSLRDQYSLTGFDDTDAYIYIQDEHLYAGVAWQWFWKGPYRVFKISLTEV